MLDQVPLVVFAVIMGLAAGVWLWSLSLALSIGGGAAKPEEWMRQELNGTPDDEQGERTIHGDPEKLSKALVKSLLQVNIGMFGSLFEVTERTAKRVVLKKTGPLVCNQPAGLYFSEAEINFEPLGGDAVRVNYRLGFSRLARAMRRAALAIIFLAGLPLLLLAAVLGWFVVLPNEEPAVRWQILQCLHVAHALWPPFLCTWIYWAGRRQSKTFLSNLLTTLELAD